jgi:hypothetical protein
MAYSVYGDVTKQFPQTAGMATANITEYISQSDSEIDGLLARAGYSTPLASTPGVIKKLSIYKSALQCYLQLVGTDQTNAPLAAQTLSALILDMETKLVSGDITLTSTKLTVTPDTYVIPLDDTDESQFNLPNNFELENPSD